jgi:hypothetical protein
MQLLLNNVQVEVALRKWALTKPRRFFIGLLTLSRTYIAARKAPTRGNLDISRTFAERELCTDSGERKRLSKLIFRDTRNALRRWKTQRITERLVAFERLRDLDRIHAHVVQKKSCPSPDFDKTAEFFNQILYRRELQ